MAIDSFEFTLGGGEPERLRAAPMAADLIASGALPLPKNRNIRILEIGSGASRDGMWLRQAGYDVTSMDLDFAPLQEAYESPHATHRFVQADACKLPFAPNSVHAIMLGYVLQDIIPEKIDGVFQEMQRVTRMNGVNIVRVYVGTPEERLNRSHHTILRAGELDEIYEKCGWNIITPKDLSKPRVRAPITAYGPITNYEQVIARKPTMNLPGAKRINSIRTPLGQIIHVGQLPY